VRVVGISVDPPEVSAEHRRKVGYTIRLLADQQGETIRRYDLLHEQGGPGGTDISRPAEFYVDPSGIVRWTNITKAINIRATPSQILRGIDAAMTGE
jgi:peroxiredoxin